MAGRLQRFRRSEVFLKGSPSTVEGSKEPFFSHQAASSCLLYKPLLTRPEPDMPSKAPQRQCIHCIFMKQTGFVACKRKGPSWGTELGESDGKKHVHCAPACFFVDPVMCETSGIARKERSASLKKFFTVPTTKERLGNFLSS